jgi:hypothetical protein
LEVTLSQKDDKCIEHSVAYASRKLTKAEQKYTCTERELISLVFGTQHFRHYLLGQISLDLYTDHSALKYMTKMKDVNGRISRWFLKLAGFNIKIHHKSGNHIEMQKV